MRLQAATLNRVDLYMRDSGAGITHQLPQIMGLDGAGIVEEADADEKFLQPGQSVVLHPGIGCRPVIIKPFPAPAPPSPCWKSECGNCP